MAAPVVGLANARAGRLLDRIGVPDGLAESPATRGVCRAQHLGPRRPTDPVAVAGRRLGTAGSPRATPGAPTRGPGGNARAGTNRHAPFATGRAVHAARAIFESARSRQAALLPDRPVGVRP